MDIYREELLDHYRNPNNWGLREGGLIEQAVNELCGDEVFVQVFLRDKMIEEMRFEGHGCVISRAACSVVSEFIKGKNVNEVKSLKVDDVQRLLGTNLPPRRWSCAMLGLEGLQKLVA